MLTIGARLGSYEIVALLGTGGMGEVYRAHDVRLDRDVAIKVLPEAFAHDGDRAADRGALRDGQAARAAPALATTRAPASITAIDRRMAIDRCGVSSIRRPAPR